MQNKEQKKKIKKDDCSPEKEAHGKWSQEYVIRDEWSPDAGEGPITVARDEEQRAMKNTAY